MQHLPGCLADGDGNDNDDDSEGDSDDDVVVVVIVVVDDDGYVWMLWHMLKEKCINILILHRKLAARTLHLRYAYS